MAKKRVVARAVDLCVDYGSKMAGEKVGVVVGLRVGPDGRRVMGGRNVTQRPLDRYVVRGVIKPQQYQAGMQLYRTWYGAGRSPVVCGDYNQRVARGSGGASEAIEMARESYRRALGLLPKAFVGVVVAVCLVGESAGDWAHAAGKREEVGIEYLRDGLDALVEHYRMA